MRVRGTLIMSFDANGQAALPTSWQAFAEAETDWLAWALERRDPPSIDELLAQETA